MNRVFEDILDERERQDAKWGVQDHDYPLWRVILGEELGEADQEWLRCHFGERHRREELRMEMVQCAAVLVAMIECHDRRNQ